VKVKKGFDLPAGSACSLSVLAYVIMQNAYMAKIPVSFVAYFLIQLIKN
jgi:hypothetical protein